MTNDPSPRPLDVQASEATLYIPTPLHPRSEIYAEKRFKRVLRPGVDGWSREECIRECDAACESSRPSTLCVYPLRL